MGMCVRDIVCERETLRGGVGVGAIVNLVGSVFFISCN